MAGEEPGEPHPLVGASLGGRYRVVRRLHADPRAASSPFERSAVFEATDEEGKTFAVKVIRRDLVSDDALSRFIRAVSLMAGAQSDRIVPILDVGHDIERDLVFIVMPLLEGEDLATVLARTGPLAPDVALRIMRQAADAVASAHALDLVHRNVKPANLFLETREGGTVHLRITDFAIGNRTGAEGANRASKLALRYLSPEQASSSKSIDRRTDVWSLGATMYELLTGAAPWSDPDSLPELVAAMESGEAPSLQDRAPWVDPSIAAIVQRAMSRDPERRFATANAMGARLRALLGGDEALTRAMLVPIDPRIKAVVAARIDTSLPNAFAPTVDSADAPPTSIDPLLGHKLGGRYLVKRLLGTGGMGAVYEVESPGGGRFAAKVILRDIADQNVALVARFLREGRSATRIQDEHVTRTIELGTDIVLGVPFIVMELLHGRDLGAVIKERGALEPLPLLRVFLQAARGLAAAHAEGIIHRDVKPGNIFLHVPEGADGGALSVDESRAAIAKICDFGLAKATEAFLGDHSSHELTQSGGMLGTPYYMSPEHASNAKSVDFRTDVWSLCASLFEGLSGRKLWADYASLGELIAAIWSQPVPSLADVAPGIDPAIAAVVDRGLARDPQRRWESMNALADALERLVRGSDAVTIAELTHVPSSRLGKPVRSPRAMTWTGEKADGATPLSERARAAESRPTRGETPPQGSMVSLETGSVQVTPPPTMPERGARSPIRKRRASWQIGIGVIAAAAMGGAALFAARTAKTGGANGQGGNGDAAIAIAAPVASSPDFGSTMSTNAQAVAAYRAGMQAFRDGAGDIARQKLDKAIELDPAFAAAHLRRVVLALKQDPSTRDHALEANNFRAALSVHDRELLEAYLPWASVPRDTVETERRLAALVAAAPNDVDYAYSLCRLRSVEQYRNANEACEATLRLDPAFVDAQHLDAVNREQVGDISGAIEGYNACYNSSRTATSCLAELAFLQSAEGSCADAIATTRKWVGLDPNAAQPYRMLASALFATGASIESVREVFEQGWQRMDADSAAIDRAQVETSLAILSGDFANATVHVADWEKRVAKRTDEWPHLLVTLWRVSIDVELGRKVEASRSSEAFFKRRSAWSPSPPPDFSIYLNAANLRLGNIGTSAWTRARDLWLTNERAAENVVPPSTQWVYAFANAAFDRASANEAVEASSHFLPLNYGSTRTPDFDEATARVYLLADRPRDALPFGQRAARSCTVIDSPLETTQGFLHSGAAYAALGDIEAACSALATVLRRWGGTPASTTANTARRVMAPLKCPPSAP